MIDLPVSQNDLQSCRETSDKQFLALTKNLDDYHKKMDSYMNRLLPATNGKRSLRAPDDLIVETWEAILILRDFKKFFEIIRRWKKVFIFIGVLVFLLITKWQIADFLSLLSKYHIIK